MKKIHAVFLKKKYLAVAAAALLCIGLLALLATQNTDDSIPAVVSNSDYVILAANDLGMHCIQDDYSSFLILPPANNLKVQVFKKGKKEAQLIQSGITVRYEIINNTSSADKVNFWDYAADYGYKVAPNIGITGNGLKGECALSKDKKYYEATAIPVVPYNDKSTTLNPYQIARITVIDQKTGKTLVQTENTVIPVSTEMDCYNCHGRENTDLNILKSHDKLSDTHLAQDLKDGKRYKCSDCHADNALGQAGKKGIPPLSEAMHGFHANKVPKTDSNANPKSDPVCYSCHPGPVTQCYRGIMSTSGIGCVDGKCHGDMKNVAQTQKDGRQAWLQEPDCANCHGAKYGVNKNTLYRNSFLKNAPSLPMKNLILCASCHNSPHAEWKSALKQDNELPLALLGYESFINQCTVCHQGKGDMHR